MNIKNKFYFTKNHLWYILAIVVLVVDLVTKAITDGIVYQPAIPGIFCIESYHNTGASFSIFAGSAVAQIIFIVLGILASIGLVLYSIMAKNANLNTWFFIGASLMLAGIIGNVVDRIALGYVRDFISLEFMNFAVFNVADTALTIGSICLVVWLLFFAYRNTKEEKIGKENI